MELVIAVDKEGQVSLSSCLKLLKTFQWFGHWPKIVIVSKKSNSDDHNFAP